MMQHLNDAESLALLALLLWGCWYKYVSFKKRKVRERQDAWRKRAVQRVMRRHDYLMVRAGIK